VQDPLARWLDTVPFIVMALEEIELAGNPDIRLDCSGESLGPLERAVLDRFGVPEDVSWAEERAFLNGVVAYLGETLMRVAGGRWGWIPGDDPEGFPDGVPLVEPDPTLGLAPVSPVHLVEEAVRRGGGELFGTRCRAWRRAVQERRRVQPSWTPHRERTMLDPLPDPPQGVAEWLGRRDAAFTGWIAAYAPSVTWDFSPASLTALEGLVRRVTPTTTDLYDPANRDFVAGATWYLGEVLRRGLGGRWNVRDDRTDPDGEPPVDDLFVDDLGPWDSHCLPVVVLEAALGDRGQLRAHYDTFSE
jgi:hypothetical protein